MAANYKARIAGKVNPKEYKMRMNPIQIKSQKNEDQLQPYVANPIAKTIRQMKNLLRDFFYLT